MYSHELQTCDWPRNVGCEVVDSGSSASNSNSQREAGGRSIKQHASTTNQHVPSRVRFGSAFSNAAATSSSSTSAATNNYQPVKPTVPQQYHRQPPQTIQAQVQTIPPPPELKVPPNPVITSRGQPKPLLDSQEDIAKLYADAHDTLPPVEEEETDRQQRVYRGQPSTVSQVQRDRDGIIQQASLNAIPNHGKIGSFAFGSQYRDIEYHQQQQQQQQAPSPPRYQQQQQSVRQQPQTTYRPLEILTTPAPAQQQVPQRETSYKNQNSASVEKQPTYSNQQALVYNTDYDEDLLAQIEQDNNAYDQPTRAPLRTNSNTRNRGSSQYAKQERDSPAAVSNNRGTHPPRTRPTLKPSGTIVSKAQEFVDIYRNPPTRPEPLYPQPTPDKAAAKCRRDVCLLPDCSCGGRDIPGDLPVESVPQIVLITFDDSVNDLNKQLYIDLFEKGRVNPNGCPITATFYVSHEWTDYSQVQNLYSDGHEMASHTVSHSFGEQFSQKKWTREVAGQREILAAYGGVKLSDVRGMRAPFLSVGGNKMYKMLYDSNFTYDSSMPVYENRPPSWPYTLDYKIFHDCMIPPCPTRSYPGVWQVPMVMWQDLNGGRCSMGDACSNPGEADGVFKMIMKNFERHYTTNRAPFGLFYHAAWFTQPHHKEGFIKFLDAINAMQDVWIVTNWQMLQWVRDPTPISRINSFQPFQCDYSDRPKRCNNPKVCNLWHKSGVRYMKTCQPCPDIYPWTGKSGIRSSRVDNDIEESTA